MSNRRWSKFWWQDWQRDESLALVSLAAQGFWMRLLCIAHDGEPYGYVTVNGKSPTQKMLAKIARVSEKEAAKLIEELEESGIFSRAEDGTIYSRRMVKDKAESEKSSAYGKAGGNPILKPKTEQAKGGPLTPPLIPEAEAEREEERKKDSEASLLPCKPGEWPDVRTELWNDGLTILRGLTGKPVGPSRALLGKLVKSAFDDCGMVLAKLREAASLRPVDPVAWITAAVSADGNENAKILRAAGLAPDGTLLSEITINHETQPRFLQ